MLEYARKDISPKDIMLFWKEKQAKFLDEVFQSYRKALNHPDELKLIDKNVWYAASGAYAVKDWNRLDELVKPPEFKPKQKDLEAVSMHQFGNPWGALDSAQQEYVLGLLRIDYNKKYMTSFKTVQPMQPRPRQDAGLVTGQIMNEPVRGTMAAPVDFQRIVTEAQTRVTNRNRLNPMTEVLDNPLPATLPGDWMADATREFLDELGENDDD